MVQFNKMKISSRVFGLSENIWGIILEYLDLASLRNLVSTCKGLYSYSSKLIFYLQELRLSNFTQFKLETQCVFVNKILLKETKSIRFGSHSRFKSLRIKKMCLKSSQNIDFDFEGCIFLNTIEKIQLKGDACLINSVLRHSFPKLNHLDITINTDFNKRVNLLNVLNYSCLSNLKLKGMIIDYRFFREITLKNLFYCYNSCSTEDITFLLSNEFKGTQIIYGSDKDVILDKIEFSGSLSKLSMICHSNPSKCLAKHFINIKILELTLIKFNGLEDFLEIYKSGVLLKMIIKSTDYSKINLVERFYSFLLNNPLLSKIQIYPDLTITKKSYNSNIFKYYHSLINSKSNLRFNNLTLVPIIYKNQSIEAISGNENSLSNVLLYKFFMISDTPVRNIAFRMKNHIFIKSLDSIFYEIIARKEFFIKAPILLNFFDSEIAFKLKSLHLKLNDYYFSLKLLKKVVNQSKIIALTITVHNFYESYFFENLKLNFHAKKIKFFEKHSLTILPFIIDKFVNLEKLTVDCRSFTDIETRVLEKFCEIFESRKLEELSLKFLRLDKKNLKLFMKLIREQKNLNLLSINIQIPDQKLQKIINLLKKIPIRRIRFNINDFSMVLNEHLIN